MSARLVLTGGRVGSYSWIAPPCFIEFFKEFFCVTIGKITMLKMVAAGVTALFLSASPVAYAHASSDEVMEPHSRNQVQFTGLYGLDVPDLAGIFVQVRVYHTG